MGEARKIAVFAVRKEGLKVAERLLGLGGVAIYPPERLKGGGLKREAASAWRCSALVFIGAAGIAVRTIAPFLKNKASDPAVVVIDDSGKFVVSLLSGHLGGANSLAIRIAALINAIPVVTTATDSRGLPCVEDIAGRFGLGIEDFKKIKKINSAILDNGKVLIVDRNRARLALMKKVYGRFDVIGFRKDYPSAGRGAVFVAVTPFTGSVPGRLKASTLILRPREFVAGIGCKRGTSAVEIERAFMEVLKKNGIAPGSIKKLATIDIKRDEPGLQRFAGKHGFEMDFFSPRELSKRTKRKSEMVLKYTGAGGVSEPASLLGARAKRLWSRKIITGKVTVALAREPFTSSE